MVRSSIAADNVYPCIKWEIDTSGKSLGLTTTEKHHAFNVSKVCGCHLVHFSCSPTSAIGFTQWNLCCINKSNMKHTQKSDWKLDLPWFSFSYQKCMFVNFLTASIHSPPNCIHGEVDKIEDKVQPLLNICLYGVCSLILTKPHTNQI